MNDQIILNVTKRGGALEVTTRGTGQDQLNAIRVAAAATFRVLPATFDHSWFSAAHYNPKVLSCDSTPHGAGGCIITLAFTSC